MTKAAKTLNTAVGEAIVHIAKQRTRIKELEHLVKESFLELEEKEELEYVKRRFKEMKDYLEAVEYFLKQLMKKGEITPAVIKKIKIT